MNELKARGVEGVLVVVCDGLTGLPAAVTACWPGTIVQTCIVHYADVRVMPMSAAEPCAGQVFWAG
jgi:transposase-like protein